MKILTVGINHKTSSIESREKFFLTTMERELLLSEFKNDPSVIASIILSTCNRCEIYANVDDDYHPHEILKRLFSLKHQPQTHELQKLFYVLQGQEAVVHLLRVACGLDSLILGEKQILGQIKDALLLSRQNLMLDKTFNILSNFVLETSKKARRETHIDFGGSSVSWASVKMAQNILGSLQEATVLILGSGKMGRLAVEQLINKGVKEIYIMNRTMEKAQELAQHSGGRAVGFWQMKEILPQVDVCICSASCVHYLIDRDLVENTMRVRNGKKLVCVDISVPRNIDPQVAQVQDVCLVTIDDLDRVVQDNIQKRLSAAHQVEEIILNKGREFHQVMDKRHAKNAKNLLFVLVVLSGVILSNTVLANTAMIKAYKEAFPHAHPKCINCHVSAWSWNAYGLAVKKAAKEDGLEHPTTDTFKKVGRIEDFKESGEIIKHPAVQTLHE